MHPLKRRPGRIYDERGKTEKYQDWLRPPRIGTHRAAKAALFNRQICSRHNRRSDFRTEVGCFFTSPAKAKQARKHRAAHFNRSAASTPRIYAYDRSTPGIGSSLLASYSSATW